MNKKDVIKEVAEKLNYLQKDVEEVLNTVIDIITENLAKGNSVNFVGFGKFEVCQRSAREGRNPQTGESMTIPSHNVPKFKPGKLLKDKVKS